MLHVALVRSPVAHGTINSVDLGDAESMPGVVAVYHAGNDLGMPAMQGFPMLPPDYNRPIFASDRVRFVGDVIAAVVAESQAQANDAAEQVFADIDAAARRDDGRRRPRRRRAAAVPRHRLERLLRHGVRQGGRRPVRGRRRRRRGDDGQPASGRRADGEQRRRRAFPRTAGSRCGCRTRRRTRSTPDTPRCSVSRPRSCASSARGWAAGSARRPPPTSSTSSPARRRSTLGKPVKWAESRSEDMVSLVHGRDYVMTARLGVNNDGTIVGLDCEVLAAAGAYPAIGAILPMLTQMMSVGVYEIPKVRFDAKTVLTNNTTDRRLSRCRPPRGDAVDRARARRRRRPDRHRPGRDPPRQLHAARHVPAHHDHRRQLRLGRVREGTRRRARGRRATPTLRAEQAARRASGDTKQIGIGVSTYVEVTAPVGLHIEWGACEVNDDGSATVFAGTSVHGQGHRTAFAMLASDVLGIPMDKITLVNSDTARVPRGSGTLGSRSLQTAGSAIHVASEGVLDRAKQIAAHMLEASPDDIVVGDGGLQVAGVPANAVPGRTSQQHRRTRRSCPTASSRARCATSSTSTAPIRRSRSAPTCRWSRSTPRPAASRCCVTSRSTTAVASSTRCWSVASSTAASPRARRRRCTSRSRTTPTATRSRRTCRLRDPVGRRVVQLRDVEHPDRQPAQPARREGHRRVGHDRVHPGDPERRRRRRLAPRRHAHRHALHRRASVGGDPERPIEPGARPDPTPWRATAAISPATAAPATPWRRSTRAPTPRGAAGTAAGRTASCRCRDRTHRSPRATGRCCRGTPRRRTRRPRGRPPRVDAARGSARRRAAVRRPRTRPRRRRRRPGPSRVPGPGTPVAEQSDVPCRRPATHHRAPIGPRCGRNRGGTTRRDVASPHATHQTGPASLSRR